MNEKPVYLIIQNSGQTWLLNNEQKNIIGRGIPKAKEGNLILLPHPTISKLHAQVWFDEQTQQWHFENLSRNGSYIEGNYISGRSVLHDGAKITIGPYEMLFCENLLVEEGTVEVQRPMSLASRKSEDSSSAIETAALLILFGLAIALILYLC